MSNGPPTPPATTPAELQDEARFSGQSITESSVSAAPEPPQTTQSVPESYQSALPAMIETIARNDYQQLVKIAEYTDYNVSPHTCNAPLKLTINRNKRLQMTGIRLDCLL